MGGLLAFSARQAYEDPVHHPHSNDLRNDSSWNLDAEAGTTAARHLNSQSC